MSWSSRWSHDRCRNVSTLKKTLLYYNTLDCEEAVIQLVNVKHIVEAAVFVIFNGKVKKQRWSFSLTAHPLTVKRPRRAYLWITRQQHVTCKPAYSHWTHVKATLTTWNLNKVWPTLNITHFTFRHPITDTVIRIIQLFSSADEQQSPVKPDDKQLMANEPTH